MNTREQIRYQLEQAALAAGDKKDELARQVQLEKDPERRKVLQLRLQEAATDWERCLQALFGTPRTL
jgi:hypothetical protein